MSLVATSLLACILLLSCDKRPGGQLVDRAVSKENDEVVDVADQVVDITELERNGHPAAKDLIAVIHAEREKLAACAEPVRYIVRERRNEIGFGRVGVVMDVVSKREGYIELNTLDVEPVFALQPEFSDCIRSTLRSKMPVTASADYTLRVRVHLCVQPESLERATLAGKT